MFSIRVPLSDMVIVDFDICFERGSKSNTWSPQTYPSLNHLLGVGYS